MEKDEMIKKMVELLAEEFEVEQEAIQPEANIKETMHLDSLSLVDMVGLVNEEFGVEIKTPDLPSLKTFADLYDYVYTRL
jgi:acyl carrier protein